MSPQRKRAIRWRQRQDEGCMWPGCRQESEVTYLAGSTLLTRGTHVMLCDRHQAELHELLEKRAGEPRQEVFA